VRAAQRGRQRAGVVAIEVLGEPRDVRIAHGRGALQRLRGQRRAAGARLGRTRRLEPGKHRRTGDERIALEQLEHAVGDEGEEAGRHVVAEAAQGVSRQRPRLAQAGEEQRRVAADGDRRQRGRWQRTEDPVEVRLLGVAQQRVALVRSEALEQDQLVARVGAQHGIGRAEAVVAGGRNKRGQRGRGRACVGVAACHRLVGAASASRVNAAS